MKAKIISFNLVGQRVPPVSADPQPPTLNYQLAEGDFQEPHGTLQHVAHIPQPGVICQLKLGAAGLQYTRAGVLTHVIPRDQLITLFEKLEPKFAEKPNGSTRPREVDELGAPKERGLQAASIPSTQAPINHQPDFPSASSAKSVGKNSL